MTIIKNPISSALRFVSHRISAAVRPEKQAHSQTLSKLFAVSRSTVELISYRKTGDSLERKITERVLADFNIGKDFLAVRIQENQFTDNINKQIQGHQNTLAKVRDWYNPFISDFGRPMGKLRVSGDIAKQENANALNVMLMSKEDFQHKILQSNDSAQQAYGLAGKSSWVVAPLTDLLDKGAKVYPDEYCSSRTGQPFIITLPQFMKVDVDIYPVK